MFTYLDNFEDPEELRALTAWKAHTFTGVWRTTVSPQERKRMPMKNPPHPGEFIRTEIIEPAGLSVTAAAAALRVSRPALSSLLNGRADLSGGMALRIEKALGVKMDTLMCLQASYDIAQTRKRETEIRVPRFPPHRGSPVASPLGARPRITRRVILSALAPQRLPDYTPRQIAVTFAGPIASSGTPYRAV